MIHTRQTCTRPEMQARLCSTAAPWPTSSGTSQPPPPITGSAHWPSGWPSSSPGLGGLAAVGGEYSDEFSTPGHGVASGPTTSWPSASRPSRATRPASHLRGFRRHAARRVLARPPCGGTVAEIAGQPNVTSAVSPLSREGAGQLSRDGRVGFVAVQYDRQAGELGAGAGDRARGGLTGSRQAQTRASRCRATARIVDQAEQATGRRSGSWSASRWRSSC